MGTHPIFESDFDCLTEMIGRPSSILARRVVLTSQPVTKRNAGYKSWLDVLEYHGSNYAEVRFWQKINFYFAPVMTAISLWIGAHLRHPHSIDRDPWNPAPWLNNCDVEQPFGKWPCWFYNPAVNYRAGKGFDDGRNNGVKEICGGPVIGANIYPRLTWTDPPPRKELKHLPPQ